MSAGDHHKKLFLLLYMVYLLLRGLHNHQMLFHDLLKYEDENFYKEHKTIIFDTLDGPGTYTVIAAFYTKAYPEDDTEHYNIYSFINAESETAFDDNVSR